jgi:hypothetical protein
LECAAVPLSLDGNLEEAGDERGLAPDVSPFDVSNLPLSDHRHRLETGQRSSCRSETAESKAGLDQSLDATVILLDNVVIWHV